MSNVEKVKVVIITGLSGAGKSRAADWFEDQGYYVIDNMPPALIPNFLELAQFNGEITRAAFVVDIRSEHFLTECRDVLEALRHKERIDLKILYIEASTGVLLRRFSESRRNHPLASGKTNAQVIDLEREMMEDIRSMSDYVMDTSQIKVAELYAEIAAAFAETDGAGRKKQKFTVNIMSFGFKHGVPQDVDMMLDMRFLPNPFYVNSLRPLTGNNKKVQKYVMKYPESQKFLSQLEDMLDLMIPCHVNQGKYYLNIAFGCTGGQHRSVVMANQVYELLKAKGLRVTIEHREL